MTDTLIPYSFIPGTKAKAQEVNANFIALADSITGNVTTINSTKLDKDLSNITQTGINFIKNNSAPPRNVGEIVTSTIPLTDAGLHLLDGALLQYGSYKAFIDYIAGLATDYPDLFETEANWQSAVTTYGVCGKFVYDDVNNTVRLPKVTGILEGTTDATALGDLVQAGLPNITASGLGGGHANSNPLNNVSGAFTRTSSSIGATHTSGSADYGLIGFDASHSNSIYGNSSTVQPQTIKVLYYIVTATSTKTEIAVDIDEIATDLNGKADTDLTNINNSGTSLSASWAFPSTTSDNITIGASGASYTAPANGWYCVIGTTTVANGYVYYSGVGLYDICYAATAGYTVAVTTPVKKGNSVSIGYGGATVSSIKFVYAQGSESEAQ